MERKSVERKSKLRQIAITEVPADDSSVEAIVLSQALVELLVNDPVCGRSDYSDLPGARKDLASSWRSYAEFPRRPSAPATPVRRTAHLSRLSEEQRRKTEEARVRREELRDLQKEKRERQRAQQRERRRQQSFLDRLSQNSEESDGILSNPGIIISGSPRKGSPGKSPRRDSGKSPRKDIKKSDSSGRHSDGKSKKDSKKEKASSQFSVQAVDRSKNNISAQTNGNGSRTDVDEVVSTTSINQTLMSSDEPFPENSSMNISNIEKVIDEVVNASIQYSPQSFDYDLLDKLHSPLLTTELSDNEEKEPFLDDNRPDDDVVNSVSSSSQDMQTNSLKISLMKTPQSGVEKPSQSMPWTITSTTVPEIADADSSTPNVSKRRTRKMKRVDYTEIEDIWEPDESDPPVRESKTSGRRIKPAARVLENAIVDASLKKSPRKRKATDSTNNRNGAGSSEKDSLSSPLKDAETSKANNGKKQKHSQQELISVPTLQIQPSNPQPSSLSTIHPAQTSVPYLTAPGIIPAVPPHPGLVYHSGMYHYPLGIQPSAPFHPAQNMPLNQLLFSALSGQGAAMQKPPPPLQPNLPSVLAWQTVPSNFAHSELQQNPSASAAVAGAGVSHNYSPFSSELSQLAVTSTPSLPHPFPAAPTTLAQPAASGEVLGNNILTASRKMQPEISKPSPFITSTETTVAQTQNTTMQSQSLPPNFLLEPQPPSREQRMSDGQNVAKSVSSVIKSSVIPHNTGCMQEGLASKPPLKHSVQDILTGKKVGGDGLTRAQEKSNIPPLFVVTLGQENTQIPSQNKNTMQQNIISAFSPQHFLSSSAEVLRVSKSNPLVTTGEPTVSTGRTETLSSKRQSQLDVEAKLMAVLSSKGNSVSKVSPVVTTIKSGVTSETHVYGSSTISSPQGSGFLQYKATAPTQISKHASQVTVIDRGKAHTFPIPITAGTTGSTTFVTSASPHLSHHLSAISQPQDRNLLRSPPPLSKLGHFAKNIKPPPAHQQPPATSPSILVPQFAHQRTPPLSKGGHPSSVESFRERSLMMKPDRPQSGANFSGPQQISKLQPQSQTDNRANVNLRPSTRNPNDAQSNVPTQMGRGLPTLPPEYFKLISVPSRASKNANQKQASLPGQSNVRQGQVSVRPGQSNVRQGQVSVRPGQSSVRPPQPRNKTPDFPQGNRMQGPSHSRVPYVPSASSNQHATFQTPSQNMGAGPKAPADKAGPHKASPYAPRHISFAIPHQAHQVRQPLPAHSVAPASRPSQPADRAKSGFSSHLNPNQPDFPAPAHCHVTPNVLRPNSQQMLPNAGPRGPNLEAWHARPPRSQNVFHQRLPVPQAHSRQVNMTSAQQRSTVTGSQGSGLSSASWHRVCSASQTISAGKIVSSQAQNTKGDRSSLLCALDLRHDPCPTTNHQQKAFTTSHQSQASGLASATSISSLRGNQLSVSSSSSRRVAYDYPLTRTQIKQEFYEHSEPSDYHSALGSAPTIPQKSCAPTRASVTSCSMTVGRSTAGTAVIITTLTGKAQSNPTTHTNTETTSQGLLAARCLQASNSAVDGSSSKSLPELRKIKSEIHSDRNLNPQSSSSSAVVQSSFLSSTQKSVTSLASISSQTISGGVSSGIQASQSSNSFPVSSSLATSLHQSHSQGISLPTNSVVHSVNIARPPMSEPETMTPSQGATHSDLNQAQRNYSDPAPVPSLAERIKIKQELHLDMETGELPHGQGPVLPATGHLDHRGSSQHGPQQSVVPCGRAESVSINSSEFVSSTSVSGVRSEVLPADSSSTQDGREMAKTTLSAMSSNTTAGDGMRSVPGTTQNMGTPATSVATACASVHQVTENSTRTTSNIVQGSGMSVPSQPYDSQLPAHIRIKAEQISMSDDCHQGADMHPSANSSTERTTLLPSAQRPVEGSSIVKTLLSTKSRRESTAVSCSYPVMSSSSSTPTMHASQSTSGVLPHIQIKMEQQTRSDESSSNNRIAHVTLPNQSYSDPGNKTSGGPSRNIQEDTTHKTSHQNMVAALLALPIHSGESNRSSIAQGHMTSTVSSPTTPSPSTSSHHASYINAAAQSQMAQGASPSTTLHNQAISVISSSLPPHPGTHQCRAQSNNSHDKVTSAQHQSSTSSADKTMSVRITPEASSSTTSSNLKMRSETSPDATQPHMVTSDQQEMSKIDSSERHSAESHVPGCRDIHTECNRICEKPVGGSINVTKVVGDTEEHVHVQSVLIEEASLSDTQTNYGIADAGKTEGINSHGKNEAVTELSNREINLTQNALHMEQQTSHDSAMTKIAVVVPFPEPASLPSSLQPRISPSAARREQDDPLFAWHTMDSTDTFSFDDLMCPSSPTGKSISESDVNCGKSNMYTVTVSVPGSEDSKNLSCHSEEHVMPDMSVVKTEVSAMPSGLNQKEVIDLCVSDNEEDDPIEIDIPLSTPSIPTAHRTNADDISTTGSGEMADNKTNSLQALDKESKDPSKANASDSKNISSCSAPLSVIVDMAEDVSSQRCLKTPIQISPRIQGSVKKHTVKSPVTGETVSISDEQMSYIRRRLARVSEDISSITSGTPGVGGNSVKELSPSSSTSLSKGQGQTTPLNSTASTSSANRMTTETQDSAVSSAGQRKMSDSCREGFMGRSEQKKGSSREKFAIKKETMEEAIDVDDDDDNEDAMSTASSELSHTSHMSLSSEKSKHGTPSRRTSERHLFGTSSSSTASKTLVSSGSSSPLSVSSALVSQKDLLSPSASKSSLSSLAHGSAQMLASIASWSNEEVKDWLKKHKLDCICPNLSSLDGKGLQRMAFEYQRDPDVFYTRVKKTLGLSLFQTLVICRSMKELTGISVDDC